MKHSLRFLLLFCTLCLLVMGCASNEKSEVKEKYIIPPSGVRLNQIYQSYIKGDCKTLLSFIHNYKDKPRDFQQQVVNLLYQHRRLRAKDSLQVSAVSGFRIDMNHAQKYADIYMTLSYGNSEEEIVIPMIYDCGKWWIK